VYDQGDIYVYGGVASGIIVNELWRFNVTSSSWSLVTAVADEPLAAVGHSAHCIDNSMFIIFGHHPVYGYLNTVQLYDFGTYDSFCLSL